MGKIFNELSSMIQDAIKGGETAKANAYRNLKDKMLNWKTSSEGAKIVNNNDGEIPEEYELKIIDKYLKELSEDAVAYSELKPELSASSAEEASYLIPFKPKPATKDEVKACVEKWMQEQNVESIGKKQMSTVINYIKYELKFVNGRMASDIVREYIKNE